MIPLLKDKSYSFAVEIVRLVQYLQQEKKEYVLSKQILKSGTSIGALIHEAVFAQSDSDYLNKLAVSLKEANETLYWLNLLRDTDYIHIDLYEKLGFKKIAVRKNYYKDSDGILMLKEVR